MIHICLGKKLLTKFKTDGKLHPCIQVLKPKAGLPLQRIQVFYKGKRVEKMNGNPLSYWSQQQEPALNRDRRNMCNFKLWKIKVRQITQQQRQTSDSWSLGFWPLTCTSVTIRRLHPSGSCSFPGSCPRIATWPFYFLIFKDKRTKIDLENYKCPLRQLDSRRVIKIIHL